MAEEPDPPNWIGFLTSKPSRRKVILALYQLPLRAGTISEIKRLTSVSRNTIQEVLRELVKEGYVRDETPNKARWKSFSLTAQGLRAAAKLHPATPTSQPPPTHQTEGEE